MKRNIVVERGINASGTQTVRNRTRHISQKRTQTESPAAAAVVATLMAVTRLLPI